LSSSNFAGLKDLDRLGELTCAQGAAELAQDAPGFELGVGAFGEGAEPGMSATGLLVGGFVPGTAASSGVPRVDQENHGRSV
jgi:hypothetical protein